MAEYIDKQKFLEEQRHLYCENCAKRKGIKRGKMQFVYEIGDAPCRACGYGDVLDDFEDFPAAAVRPVAQGEWSRIDYEPHGHDYKCSACGWKNDMPTHFCPNCGADMRKES